MDLSARNATLFVPLAHNLVLAHLAQLDSSMVLNVLKHAPMEHTEIRIRTLVVLAMQLALNAQLPKIVPALLALMDSSLKVTNALLGVLLANT